MSVKYLAQDIMKKAPGWGITDVLRKINEVQNYIYAHPCRQTMYLDPATGFPPTLATTAGKLDYEVPDITKNINAVARTLRIAKVLRVFVDATTAKQYQLPYIGELFELTPVNPFSPYSTGLDKKYFWQIPVDTLEATETDRARIMFKNDPGTTTTAFFYECVIEPLQITSTSTPLMLPQRWERAIFDGVVAQIQDNAYGKDSREAKFYEYWCPQIWYWLDQGAQSNPINTPVFY
jgi:hypothetical protein